MKSESSAGVRTRRAPTASSKIKASNAGDNNGASVRGLRFGPLADYVGYALRRAQMSSVTGFVDAMKEVDLRPTQFAVLTLINENPGVRQNDICAALGLQKANFVPLLNELQRRGLAVRKEGIADRRSSALHLTPQGVALLQRALQLHSKWEERLLARLGTRGRAQLLALLNKLM
ncbi:MAG: MarR family transcriptional regulator [Gammaproteobacteria bacterium]|nr:MarR family transcriptional regulator [Gammaproteobacteria bacterium]